MPRNDSTAAMINHQGKIKNTYDAIVIGSGISGGWAAKELCEKGLKTLVLERGRDVSHIKDYPTANLAPWELHHRGNITDQQKKKTHSLVKLLGMVKTISIFCNGSRTSLYTREAIRLD